MFCDCLSVQVLSMRLIDFYLESEAMGSLGWDQCYWCGYWQSNMYIPDGVGGPLCEWCLDSQQCYWCGYWHPGMINTSYIGGPLCEWCIGRRMCGHGPYRPHARDRAYDQILDAGLIQKLGEEIWLHIIFEYVHGEFEP